MTVESEKFIKLIKSAWTKYEYKIILIIGFLLVAIISFEVGYMQKKAAKASPIIIEKAPENPKIGLEGQADGIMASNSAPDQKLSTGADSQVPQNKQSCAFVGSKNSNKYYPPTCSYAKRIKPENLACFKTEQEATAQGRIKSTGCKY